MKALRFAQFGDPSVLELVNRGDGAVAPGPNEVIVEVRAASINPSDVKNVAGLMHRTTLPRIPGRDFAGVVVEGPSDLIGREVWGAGGDLGFVRDGSHAEYVSIPHEAVVEKPANLSFAESAASGVAFVTAWHALVDTLKGCVGETILITGAAGSVGMAAVQTARWMGMRVVGLDRVAHEDLPPALRPDLSLTLDHDVAAEVADYTHGRGVHAVLDAVGAPVFETAIGTLGDGGRYVLLANAGSEPRVSFDVIGFYRRRILLTGIDTLRLDVIAGARILDHLRPGFESGMLHPPAIARTVSLAEARTAYHLRGGSGKTVIVMPSREAPREATA